MCWRVNKATLNAILGNSNVHWFYHTCNVDRIDISTPINTLKQSMDQQTTSLSTDLRNFTNGFAYMSEKLVGNIANSNNSNRINNSNNNNKRLTDETQEEAPVNRQQKRMFLGSNTRDLSIAAVPNSQHDVDRNFSASERRESVVISNIALNITADYLTNYLSSELNIVNASIRITLSTLRDSVRYNIGCRYRRANMTR